MGVLDRYTVVLLDLNGTFMFGQDRFGPDEDFAATYRALGGAALAADAVERAVRATCDALAAAYRDPARYDDFPPVADVLRALHPTLPDAERDRVEEVIAAHELGRVPDAHADQLTRLARTHRLGLLTNIWSRKGRWVRELDRAGVLPLLRSTVFSSDHRSIKPSPVLFDLALAPFGVSRAEVVFVGDSLVCDIGGAAAAGLATVWIDPSGAGSAAATHTVPSLLALPV